MCTTHTAKFVHNNIITYPQRRQWCCVYRGTKVSDNIVCEWEKNMHDYDICITTVAYIHVGLY